MAASPSSSSVRWSSEFICNMANVIEWKSKHLTTAHQQQYRPPLKHPKIQSATEHWINRHGIFLNFLHNKRKTKTAKRETRKWQQTKRRWTMDEFDGCQRWRMARDQSVDISMLPGKWSAVARRWDARPCSVDVASFCDTSDNGICLQGFTPFISSPWNITQKLTLRGHSELSPLSSVQTVCFFRTLLPS